MLGLGWSEMLVIAVVVLIVVGPKDLPVMLRNLGRMMGSVRRMSNEFRREIDKAIAADEIRDAKKSISDPLRQTSQDITREFNSIRNGSVEPTGRLKPAESGEESVVDDIRNQAGMTARPRSQASEALRAKVSETVARPANAATTTAEQPQPIAEPAPKPKVKAAPSNGATSSAKASPAKAASRKSTSTKAADGATSTKPKPAARSKSTTASAANTKSATKPKAGRKVPAKTPKATKTTGDVSESLKTSEQGEG